MTLRRKMTWQIAAMIVGLLMVCAAALWGVRGLRRDLGGASAGYRELREIYEIAAHVSGARTLLAVGNRAAAGMEIERAVTKLDTAPLTDEPGSVLRQSTDGPRLAAAFRESIRQAAQQLRLPEDDAFHSGPEAANDAINRALGQAAGMALALRHTITEHEKAADARWHQTITLAAIVSSLVVTAAIVLGIVQYRSVITPLRRLGDAARTMAAGRFGDRVKARGDAEFRELADDFNRMAGELETLYRELEQKVAVKSRELLKSERLASVGYLAAGMAHEINNPLGIITGYGERAIQQLERSGDTTLALKHLRVMCEEAFRCKTITDKLLSLARPGDEDRKPVSLAKLAAEVVSLVEGLPSERTRTVGLHAINDAMVLGSAGELKQVALNLVLNAIDAVAGCESPSVSITVEADATNARLIVTDNGRGMSSETIERVFEPFFTEKRGGQHAGTGLGLSISHAIMESHGGKIIALSDGVGRGSRFVMEMPIV